MTDKQFNAILSDALSRATNDLDAFISDWALSSVWEDDPDADVPSDRLEQIGAIWDAAHRSVKEIAAAAGFSQRKLAERFSIPYRTMENWCGGQRSCPDYVRLMMQECLGLVHR